MQGAYMGALGNEEMLQGGARGTNRMGTFQTGQGEGRNRGQGSDQGMNPVPSKQGYPMVNMSS